MGSGNPPGGGIGTTQSPDLCACTPNATEEDDFRHGPKHVPMSNDPGQSISVTTVLGWDAGPEPNSAAGRAGRELQMFHISNAFLQLAWMNPGDCDLHLEIAESADKSAPRVIVETPRDDSFCQARQSLASALSSIGFTLSTNSGELSKPVAVDVRGLAFRDFNHSRGSGRVKTVWELHPAIVTVLPH